MSSTAFRAWARRLPACARRWPTSGCATAPTPAQPGTTRPRSATGSGRPEATRVRVLVVNAGSSSLKLSVLDGEQRVAEQELRADHTQINADEVAAAVARLGPVEAAGHRIVHGGARYRPPV